MAVELEKWLIKSAWDESRKRKQQEQALADIEMDADPVIEPENTLDLRNTVAASWKNNKRVRFVDEIDENEVARKLFVKDELLKVANMYIENHCSKNGTVNENNLSENQEKSIKMLKSRVVAEELTIYETDKTKKFVIDTLENVEKKMEKHLKPDKIVDHKEVKKLENKLNSHTSHWIEFMQMGEGIGHKRRTKSNLISEENPIPIIRGTAKDHKSCDDVKVGPDMRPIMGASIGPNTGLSQIGCQIIRKISDNVVERYDVKSTEEMLASFSEYNKSISDKKKNLRCKVIASMDINSFYPSLNADQVAKVAKIMWERSTVQLGNIDTSELAFYIAKFSPKHLLKNEGLTD